MFLDSGNLGVIKRVPPCRHWYTNIQSNPNFLIEDTKYDCCLCYDMNINNIFTKFDALPSHPKTLLERDSKKLNVKAISFTQLIKIVMTLTEKYWYDNGQVLI